MAQTADDFPSQISSWADLSYLIEHFSFFNGYDWLFRGVDDASHELIPKIGRPGTRGFKTKTDTDERIRVQHRIEDERAVLSMFEQQAQAYLSSPLRSKLEWMAIAQHYGLPTRLLDWSDSLLAAAWFAVEKGGGDKPDSAIWVTRGVPSLNLEEAIDPFELSQPRVYRPPHINPRISAQGSVLMVCPEPTSHANLTFSKKIVINKKIEFTIKKRLNACGINRRHLFPDLGGLADHLRWMYKNDWLAGYKENSLCVMADDSIGEVTGDTS